jgi:hypothetical protein
MATTHRKGSKRRQMMKGISAILPTFFYLGSLLNNRTRVTGKEALDLTRPDFMATRNILPLHQLERVGKKLERLWLICWHRLNVVWQGQVRLVSWPIVSLI